MTNLFPNYHIYILFHPETKKPLYVGSTTNVKRRTQEHRYWYKRILNIIPILQVIKTVHIQEEAWQEEFKLTQLLKSQGFELRNKANMRGKRISINSTPKIKYRTISFKVPEEKFDYAKALMSNILSII